MITVGLTGNVASGKSKALRYLSRLERRNNYLIDSHHPLRETLRRQTGGSDVAREANVTAARPPALGLRED